MSDVGLVVIGGAIGVFASAITGLFAYLSTKAHTKAQITNLQAELQHRKEESQLERLIKFRQSYLIPLKETLSKWTLMYERDSQEFVHFKVAVEKGPDAVKESEKAQERIAESSRLLGEVMEQLSQHKRQITDEKLEKLVNGLIGATAGMSQAQEPFIRQIGEMGRGEREEFGDEVIEMMKPASEALRKAEVAVNKRIEELLSGGE